MNAEQAQTLRRILATQPVAALATLHNAAPSVSMAPFAVLPGTATFLIHVSTLAAHTKDMLANPAVSLMVMAPQTPDVLPQALPRVSVQGLAERMLPDADGYAAARAAYLARFPDSAPMFGFSDFSLFRITPKSARFVGGFAQAASVTAERLVEILSAS